MASCGSFRSAGERRKKKGVQFSGASQARRFSFSSSFRFRQTIYRQNMGRWLKPDVYPLIGAMSLVTGMCVFQLTRNVFMNPDVRVNKSNRQSALLENADEGEKYSQHAFRRFVSTQRPEVFPAINRFFAGAPPAAAAADRRD